MESVTNVTVVKAVFDAVVPDLLKRTLSKYLHERREMLVEELRVGGVDLEAASRKDAFIAMLAKFHFAMLQGPAFRNLKVIAQILAHKAVSAEPREDDFIAWSDALSSMSREEIILLCTLHRNQVACIGEVEDINSEDPPQHAAMLDANGRTREALVGPGKVFSSMLRMVSAGTALGRTGLMVSYPVIDMQHFQTTAKMKRLARMARLQEWADDAMAEKSDNDF